MGFSEQGLKRWPLLIAHERDLHAIITHHFPSQYRRGIQEDLLRNRFGMTEVGAFEILENLPEFIAAFIR